MIHKAELVSEGVELHFLHYMTYPLIFTESPRVVSMGSAPRCLTVYAHDSFGSSVNNPIRRYWAEPDWVWLMSKSVLLKGGI